MINLVQIDDSKYPWSGIYFHGMCEDFVGRVSNSTGDLVGSIETPVPVEGLYDVDVYGRKAKAFVWRGHALSYRGLVVFEDDKESMSAAEVLYYQKKEFL